MKVPGRGTKMPPGKKVVHLSRIQDGARSLWQRAGGRRSTTTADHVADDGASEFPVDSLVESSFLSRDDSVENSRVVPSSPSASSPNESFQSEAAVWRQKKPSVRDGGRDDPELGTIPIHFAPDESGEGSSMIVAAPLRGSSLNDDSHNTSMDAVMAGKRPRRVTSPSRGRSSGGLRMWRAQSSDEHPLDEPKTTLAESGLLASTLVYVPSTDDATWLEIVSQLKYSYQKHAPPPPPPVSPRRVFSQSALSESTVGCDKLNETGPIEEEEEDYDDDGNVDMDGGTALRLLDGTSGTVEESSDDHSRRRRRRPRRYRKSQRRSRSPSPGTNSLPSLHSSSSSKSYISEADDSRNAFDDLLEEDDFDDEWDMVQFHLATMQYDCVAYVLTKIGIDIRDCALLCDR